MGNIRDTELSVLKDMVNYTHDCTTEELVEISQIVQRLKKFLADSKQRDQERMAKAGR